jgi:hypothetical protein
MSFPPTSAPTSTDRPAASDTAREVAVLFSGGTDSTCTALLAARDFQRVHLVTFRRFGMFGVERSDTNFRKLQALYGPDRFVRPPIMQVDKLFRHLSYGSYLRDLRRHGAMVLTTCGICKLAMHLRALVYCLDNGVKHVYDGANRNMYIFPAQMGDVLALLSELYASHGIRYENPVFELDDPQGMNFGSRVFGLSPERQHTADRASTSTGAILVEHGILPEADVKGTAIDRTMQARCYQFVLFNVYARWAFLERQDYGTYARRVHAFYADKVAESAALMDEWVPSRSRPHARLSRLLE